MVRLSRLLLFALLAVALPFHAAYGIGMAQRAACSAQSAGASPAAHSMVPEHPQAGHASHGHASGPTAGHHHGTGQDDEDGSAPHCGTCTACCTSVGIPGGVHALVLADGPGILVSFLGRRLISFEPSRLDRPPLPL
jgi:hypothetical protein